MRCRCSGAMPEPVSWMLTSDPCRRGCRSPVGGVALGRPCMASLALSKRLRKTCCSLPSLPMMRGKAGVEVGFDADLSGLELMLEQA